LFLTAIALTSALVLGVAPSAQAANIVPNPGFETNCFNVPCQWNGTIAGTISRDTTFHHAGAASLRLTAPVNELDAIAFSDCFPVTAGTTYNVQVFYRTVIPRVTRILTGPTYWSNANCTGSDLTPGAASTFSAITDGNWRSLFGTTTAPNGSPFV